ncbi:MAG TPA: metal-dependent hydrolase [Vicinamibacterales bacterium]|nr:metal-dependent hydrolase [Vicinamibacterales bacterium]
MDNLCHTLTGAALGEAGLKRLTRFANPVLMIASNLPDVDALVFVTGMPSVEFRRGWTHGVLAQALLPVVLTAVVLAFARSRPARPTGPPARAGALLALSYLGVLVHVAMDWLNNYGVRLLMPFSGRWFYGDAVFIIDPWLWLALGTGVFLARRRGAVTSARVALLLAGLYIGLMVWSAQAARARVLAEWIAQRGSAPEALMVGPAPVNPFRKIVIVDAGERYENGTFRWFGERLTFDGPTVSTRERDAAVLRARDHPRIRSILVWARFPYYEVTPAAASTRVTISDMRFGPRVGSTSVIVPE